VTGRRAAVAGVVATAALAGAVLLGLTIGSQVVGLPTVLDAVLHPQDTQLHRVVTESRIPRTALGLVVGTALGAAGALMQGLTRNALADPGILGVNAGASFAVAIAVAVVGSSQFPVLMVAALIGAVLATLAVVLIGSVSRGNPITLVLAGVALAAVLGGATTALVLIRPTAFLAMRSWESGSLAGRDLDLLTTAGPAIAAGLLLAVAMTRNLDTLALGDDAAVALGVDVRRTRAGVIVAVTLLAGTATAVAGPVAFLGLAVPHVARGLVGSAMTALVPLSAVLGAAVVVVADVVGRVVISPQEVPVGIVMAFVAAPLLVWFGRSAKLPQL